MEHITKAKEEDIPQLVALINAAYRTESANAWTTEAHLFEEGGLRIDETTLKEMIDSDDNRILKYEEDGKIYGTLCLQLEEDALHLGMFAVDPQIQGKGIGKKLILATKELAMERGKNNIVLEVLTARPELIAWYERCGFKRTSLRINFNDLEHELSIPTETLYLEKMILAL